MILGFPLHIPAASYLANLGFDNDCPAEFTVLVSIQCQNAKIVQTLDGPVDHLTRNSLTTIFDRDLEAIRLNSSEVWTVELEILLLGAKLFLYSLSLPQVVYSSLNECHIWTTRPDDLVILSSAFRTACRLIDLFSQAESGSGNKTPGVAAARRQICYPKHHFMLLCYASLFLLKLLAVTSQVPAFDVGYAQHHVQAAMDVFNRHSREHLDEHHEAAKLLEILARIEPSFYIQDPEITRVKVKTRFAASLLHDSITVARVRRHASKQSDRSSKLRETFDMNAATANTAAEPLEAVKMTHDLNQLPTDDSSVPWGVWDDDLFDSFLESFL
ncbi:hypothetical protein V1505DRAFT_307468 [Lipomyces doorenjongii]